MADYKDIAGRIRTTASDGVSVEAQEILDISKNKKQSQINAETDTTLANHASAIQGLNSQDYKTYTATELTTAETDVLPAEGSEDTIYRLGNWDGTQYDVTCYSEYSWNSSAYVHISTKSQIGEVFDISLYKASGGTLATFDNLADALDGGDNIPSALQKGGMSVKFVHTSDNKYVQYRYKSTSIANADFANINNWERYNDITTSNQSFSDLDISDEQGYVLARFQDGGIKTKNFDSSKDATTEERGLMSAADKSKLNGIEEGAEVNDVETDNTSTGDLVLSDDHGNVLVRFKDGNIKTKNFDSTKVKGYASMPAGGYENFLVQVNVGIENNSSTTTNLQDSVDLQNDRGIICLPTNYSPTGKPVRLIIAGQSSSGRITSSTTSIQKTVPHPALLLAEGYAVMQVNGTPGYTDGIETYGGMGTTWYLQSVQAAYKYVTDKYNIRKDGVLLTGWSQGTLKAWQVAANKIIPVKAMTMFGPCVDLWKLMYAYGTQAMREWMCEQFGFVEKEANKYVLDIFSNVYSEGDIVTKPNNYSSSKHVPNDFEFAYILNNYETWLGYDPICWGTSKDIIGEQFRYRNWVTVQDSNEDLCFQDVANIVPCPLKMFVGTVDDLTTTKIVNWYKKMADNAGMQCHVRIYQGGGHNYSANYPNIQTQTKYGGTITTNIPSLEGILFLERFDY